MSFPMLMKRKVLPQMSVQVVKARLVRTGPGGVGGWGTGSFGRAGTEGGGGWTPRAGTVAGCRQDTRPARLLPRMVGCAALSTNTARGERDA